MPCWVRAAQRIRKCSNRITFVVICRSFLVRKHIQPSLYSIFALVNGQGLGTTTPKAAAGQLVPRMTLTRFRRVYSACPELFAVREILAKPDTASIAQSPERRALRAMQIACGATPPESPHRHNGRTTVRHPRRNLKAAAPAKRVHVVGARPPSPSNQVSIAESAARHAASTARVSTALPAAGGCRALARTEAVDRASLRECVPLPSSAAESPQAAPELSPDRGEPFPHAAARSDLGWDEEIVGPSKKRIVRDRATNAEQPLHSGSDSDGDEGGGFMVRGATGRLLDPASLSCCEAGMVGNAAVEPAQVDVVRRPTTEEAIAALCDEGIADNHGSVGVDDESLWRLLQETEPADGHGGVTHVSTRFRHDLSMAELTLRPLGTSVQRSMQRQRRFRAALMRRLQEHHDGGNTSKLASVKLQVTIPGAPIPTARKSETMCVPKRTREDIVARAKEDESTVSAAWRLDFDAAAVPLPPHAHVLGVACLCGRPDAAEDYPGSHPSCSAGSTVALAPSSSSSFSSSTAAQPLAERLGACTFDSVEAYLQGLPWYVDQIKHVHHIAARKPQHADTTTALHPSVRMAMQARGIHKLFAHQSFAIDAALAGKHVVISTSTSSGKSLVFSAPVFDTLLRDKTAVAMFIFPTKALAQDQLRAVGEFLAGSPFLAKAVRPAVFDGDTAPADREVAWADSNLLLCNPDILHATLLPQHRRWKRVFGNLRFVVMDEAHSYRGVFGTHVAMVLRRLVRLCCRYGTRPVFFCCSATIANPAEHFRQLVPDPDLPVLPAISTSPVLSPEFDEPSDRVDAAATAEFRFGHTTASGVVAAATSAVPSEPSTPSRAAYAAEAEGDPRPDMLATGRHGFTESHDVPSVGPARFEDHGSFVVVSHDTSASGRRKFIVWNPPYLEDLMRTNSAEAEEWGGRGLVEAKATLKEQQKAERAGGFAKPQLSRTTAQKVRARRKRTLGQHNPAKSAWAATLSAGCDRDYEEDGSVERVLDSSLLNEGEDSQGDSAAGGMDDAEMRRALLAAGPAEPGEGGRPRTHSGFIGMSWRRGSGAELLRAELAAQMARSAPSAAAEPATARESPSSGPESESHPQRVLGVGGSTAMYKGQFRDRSRAAARGWGNIAGGKAAQGAVIAGRLRSEARMEWALGSPWPTATPAELLACGAAPLAQATAISSSGAATEGTPHGNDGSAANAVLGSSSASAPAGMHLKPAAGWAQALLEHRLETTKTRKSALVEASALLAAMVEGGLRTLMFCRVRRVAELTLQYAHERLSARSPHLIRKVKSYRAGYLKSHRRAIESQLFGGQLLGVVATNALELGVDIGSLDCVILLGHPGSTASMWQQAGRAGRGGRDAVAIMVTFDSPTEQYWVRRPVAMVSKPPEAALVDTSNPNILRSHAICAACEAPLAPWDLRVFGPELGTILADLRSHGVLTKTPKGRDAEFGALGVEAMRAVVTAPTARATSGAAAVAAAAPGAAASAADSGRARAFMRAPWVQDPQRNVSLRAMGDSRVLVVDAGDGNRVVDDIEYGKAIWEAYEGAIYMNQGVTYKIVKLDLSRGIASARVTNEQYYTDSREFTDLNVLSRSRTALDGRTHFGRVQSVTQVYGYRKVWKKSGKLLDMCDLSMPPYQFTSHGMWTDVPLAMKLYLDAHGMDFIGGCHAAAHAVLAALPMFVLCDRSDIGTDCANPMAERSRPLRIAIFDKRPGGIGIAAAAFQRAQAIYRKALEIVETCDCRMGCPSCCHDMACAGYNYVIDKPAAIVLLRGVLGVYPPGFQAYGGPALLQAAALKGEAAACGAATPATM